MATETIRVAWLSGNKASRDATLDKIRGSFGECDELQCNDGTTFESFEEQVLSSDCFGTNRLFILSSLPSFTGNRPTFVNRLKKLLDNIPSDCLIVFNGIDASNEKAISSHVGKIGKLFEFPDKLAASEAVEHVVKLLAQNEKKIEASEAEAFVRGIPSEDNKIWTIDQLAISVHKLCNYIGTHSVVRAEDVEALSTQTAFATPWNVFDAIDAQDFNKASLLFTKLTQCQGEGKPIDFYKRFLNLCMWRYKLLCLVKECVLANKPAEEICSFITSIQKIGIKDDNEKAPYTERHVSMALGASGPSPLKLYTRKRLVAILELLQDIQEESREIGDESDYVFLLDLFLMVASDKIDDNRRRHLWRYFQSE